MAWVTLARRFFAVKAVVLTYRAVLQRLLLLQQNTVDMVEFLANGFCEKRRLDCSVVTVVWWKVGGKRGLFRGIQEIGSCKERSFSPFLSKESTAHSEGFPCVFLVVWFTSKCWLVLQQTQAVLMGFFTTKQWIIKVASVASKCFRSFCHSPEFHSSLLSPQITFCVHQDFLPMSILSLLEKALNLYSFVDVE